LLLQAVAAEEEEQMKAMVEAAEALVDIAVLHFYFKWELPTQSQLVEADQVVVETTHLI
jgi:hypothetical protein